MKNIRRLKNAFLLVFLFSIFPIYSALAADDLLLSNYDANNILGSLPKIMTDQWITSIVDAKSGKEQAAIVILKKASQQQKLNYLLEQAPKEVMKEVARVGWQLYSIGSGTELSEIIGGFEKATANESVNYLMKIFKEQNMKISFGDFNVEYETINGDIVTSGLQYIMIYKPITETSGQIVIRIYSANSLTPPKSKGNPWSAAINYTWFSDSEIEASKLVPPFVGEIKGAFNRKKSGYWQKEIIHEYDPISSPGVNISFPAIVPKFEFPKEGWLGKILNSAKEKLQWVADFLGAGLVKEEDIFKEKTSSPTDNFINFQEELNKKIEELEKKYDQANSNSKATKSEIEKIKNDMTNLLKQFAFGNEDEETEEITSSIKEKIIIEAASSSQESIDRLLISEICAGMDNAKSEFVEIFNPNDYPVMINDDSFSLWIVDSKDKPTQKRITWIRNQIPPKGYFLFAGSDLFFSGLKFDVDAYYANQITSTGGAILSQESGEDFDKAGWGKLTAPAPESAIEEEGKILENGLESGTSLTRKMFGQGFIDTDNNEKDFDLSHFPSPRNSLGQESVYYPKSQYNFPTSGGSSSSFVPQATTSSSPKILISEVKNRGESSSDDFIELFNPTNSDVDLKGWQLKKKTSSGTESSIIVFDEGSIIKSKQYFVWASTKDGYNQKILTDASSSAYLADNNSIALLDKEKSIIDAFAWQESTNPFIEGNYFDSTHEVNQSTGRKITGSGPQYSDGNNNATDFEIQIPTPGANNVKYQASDTNNNQQNDEEDNEQSTPTQCLASDVVISEVKLSKTEYLEIFNPTSQNINLEGCFIGYFSVSNDWNNPSRVWEFENGSNIPSRQHFLIGIYSDPLNSINFDWQVKNLSGNNYSSQQIAQAGAIGIFSCDPSIQTDDIKAKDCKIDLVGWDNASVKEEKTTLAAQEEKSVSRIIAPDDIGQINYQDTDNNEEDFEIQEPTPKTFSHHNFTDLDNDGLLDIKDINVSIGFNTFLEPGEYTFKNLNIVNNAKLTIKGDCEDDLGVKLIVKNLTIEQNAAILANYVGCLQGPGVGIIGSGGGYGGRGAGDNSMIGIDSFYGEGGTTYGDFFLPSNLGSNGGAADGISGGRGGGAIIIEAEEKIDIEGLLSANGESVAIARAGAGSGGSILLTANEISGSGFITANGGNSSGGAGGGGRIAIYYNSLNIPSENVQTYGGDGSNQFDGAAGTIFLKNRSQERGELIIKNNNLSSLTQTTIENNLMLKGLEIGAGSRVAFTEDNIDSNNILISSKSILQFKDDVAIKTDSLVILGEANILDIPQKTIGIKGGTITIKEKGKIEGNILMLADNLNILEGSYLSADKMGNSSSQGFGAGDLGSGGGYGGRGGGDEPDTNTSVYGEKGSSCGDFRLPSEYGSGGGAYTSSGGYGGGLIKLEVKNISINGIISANGGMGENVSSGYKGGGGSGGGIVIKTENLSGSGEITANGGSQTYSCGGGGGRIAVYYSSKDSFLGKLKSYGGNGSGGSPLFMGDPGTIYLQQVEAGEGELKFGEVQ